LNVSQTLNYNEAWFDRDIDDNQLTRGYDYSSSTSSWFSLYGLREFKSDYLRAVRHVVTPKITFSYSPDFTDNDRFYSFGGVGVSNSDRSRKLSFSMSNGWDLKVAGKDAGQDKRINDVFTVSSSLSYDFEAENRRFSNISHSLRVKSGSVKIGLLDLSISPSGSITQDFYKFKENTLNYEKWNLAVSDWTFNVSSKIKLSGEAGYVDYFPIVKNDFIESDFFVNDSLKAEEEESVATLEEYERLEREDKKWSFSLDHSFRTDKSNYADKDYTSTLSNDLNLRLSKNWYVTYGNDINLKEKDITSHSLSLVRDLHCWKLRFKYTRQPNYWKYEIKLFNIELKDTLKLETDDQGN